VHLAEAGVCWLPCSCVMKPQDFILCQTLIQERQECPSDLHPRPAEHAVMVIFRVTSFWILVPMRQIGLFSESKSESTARFADKAAATADQICFRLSDLYSISCAASVIMLPNAIKEGPIPITGGPGTFVVSSEIRSSHTEHPKVVHSAVHFSEAAGASLPGSRTLRPSEDTQVLVRSISMSC